MKTQYPTKYKNLLIEAGLIGTGELFIKAQVAGNKRQTLDETSDTWIESEEFEVDFRGAGEYASPVELPGGLVAGDWRTGLDQEQIRAINTECGVPIYTPDTMVYLYDGKRYDLSNPVHMSEYLIISQMTLVAPNRATLAAGQRFYYVSTTEAAKEKREVRELKVKAIELANNLDTEEKRQLLKLIDFRYKAGLPSDMSDQEVRETLTDMALGTQYRRVSETYNLPDKRFWLLLYRSLANGILVSEGDRGSISYPGSTEPLAVDHERFVAYLKRDNSMYQRLLDQIASIENAGRYDRVLLPDKVELVRDYDTTIQEEGDVRLWGLGACQQYVLEKNWQPLISPADGVEKWRKLVLDIYHGKPTSLGSSNLQPVYHGGNDPYEEGEGTVLNFVSLRQNLARDVNGWKRDECRVFMEDNAELVTAVGFDFEVNNRSSTEKWQEALQTFISQLSDKQLEQLETVAKT